MKIVSPFRPFAPESPSHRLLADFDWHDALRMLSQSAVLAGQPMVWQITDVDAPEGPIPAYRYRTRHRRLMLWLLEVALCYLESEDFDQDTVWLSPDSLVLGDIRAGFVAEFGVVVRTAAKYVKAGRTVLNSAQWWAVSAKSRLIPFYRNALRLAEGLSDARLVWGADTDPLIDLLSPIVAGPSLRANLRIYGHEETTILRSLMRHQEIALDQGRDPGRLNTPILDFRYRRKAHMRAYFDAVLQPEVSA